MVPLLLANPASAQSLINLKLGPAALGIGTNDFWNHYHPTNTDGSLFDDGVLVPLYSADGTNLAAGMLVYGVQTHGTNATGDATLDSWLGATGTNLTVILTNVPYGSYDIYIYGHGDADELNSLIGLSTAWRDYGWQSTTIDTGWNTNL